MEHIDLCLLYHNKDKDNVTVDVYTNHFNSCFGGYNVGAYAIYSDVILPWKETNSMKALRYLLARTKRNKYVG